MNQVTLIGRSGANAELKHTQNGMAICNLSIATSKKKGEEYVSSWHRVVLFGKTAEMFAPRIQKGTEVFIQGEISYNQYEKNGQKITSTNIIGNWVRVIESAPKNQSSSQPGSSLPAGSMPEEPRFSEADIPF